jgi:hypothetical protein
MKKFLIYSGLVLLLVPVQTTLLPHVAIWDIKPDLGLVVAALIGVLAGELDGLLVGLAIGWILNLYLVTTGGAGLFAGLLARQVAEITPTILSVGLLMLSLAGGLVAVFSMQHSSMADTWWMVQFVVVPQACFDAVVGAALLWVVEQRLAVPRFGVLDRY